MAFYTHMYVYTNKADLALLYGCSKNRKQTI